MEKTSKSDKAKPRGPATTGRRASSRGGDKSEAEREVEQLRAEIAMLKKATAYRTDAAPSQPDKPNQDGEGDKDKDKEYQALLEDLESQMADLRRMAKEVVDPSFVNATIDNLEARAAAVRAERRATWSVPRLLDRHRARVAERAARVDKAKEKVAELEAELAKVQTELEEAKVHLVAKEEDLASETAEVARLEAQLPPTPAQPSPSKPAVIVEDAVSEQALLEGLRRLAASKGGAWQAALAAIPAGESTVETGTQEDKTQDEPMADAGQNAVVPKPVAVVASATSGASLAAVPRMVGARPQLEGNKAKQQRV